jgi:hypothetical protein
MRPSCDIILQTVANSLMNEHMPAATTEKAQADFGLSALLIGVVSEELDRAAARRIEENDEVRRLFSESLAVVEEEGLREQLRRSAEGGERDYRVSALDEANGDLLGLLIELHSHVEGLEGEGARRAEAAIWQVLENWTKRREFAANELFIQVLLASAVERVLAEEAALADLAGQ